MRYQNLRYGNPNEFAYYVQGMPVKDVARRLRRSERSVRNWLAGKEKLPWWIPELLRLQRLEQADVMRQMNMTPVRKQLGIVTGSVIDFPAAKTNHEDSNNENQIPAVDRPGNPADGLRIQTG